MQIRKGLSPFSHIERLSFPPISNFFLINWRGGVTVYLLVIQHLCRYAHALIDKYRHSLVSLQKNRMLVASARVATWVGVAKVVLGFSVQYLSLGKVFGTSGK